MRNEVYILISDKLSAYISKLNIKKLLIFNITSLLSIQIIIMYKIRLPLYTNNIFPILHYLG